MDLFNINLESIDKFSTSNSDDGTVCINVRLKRSIRYCPVCGSKLVSNGISKKLINHKVISDRNAKLFYEANRYRCKNCNYSEYEKNPFALKGFSQSILMMNQLMIDLHDPRYNYTMLAQKYNMSVNQVILYLDSFVTIPHIKLPVNLGIDEIHSNMAKRRNASYLGVLIDNDNFNLIEILPSRNKNDLNNYLSFISQAERNAVKYVTIDMWLPYKQMALKWFSNCIIAVDPFHVIEHLQFDFDKIRIRIMNKCIYGSNAYYLLKTWNKLLKSDKYKLDNEPKYNHVFKCKLNYGDIKKMLLEISEELTLAYNLKEAYRDFNSNCTYEKAKEELDNLIYDFAKANIKEYEEFVQLMINWKTEIINSFKRSEITGNRLSNAKSEAMNNGIGTNIRISRGLANFNRFRKRMLYCFNDQLFYSLTHKLTSLKRDIKKKKNKKNK